MRKLIGDELKGLVQLKDGVDGFELLNSVTINEITIGVFLRRSRGRTSEIVVDVFEFDEVTNRYLDCGWREALEVVMKTLEEVFND